MKKVIIINLNGRDYKVEEPAYDLLVKYLNQAEKRLHNNPDKQEIINDFEQAIADKCDRYLTSQKTVVTTTEIEKIIKEMGPVDTENETATADIKDTIHSKKLYQIKEGAWISGVCNGLAAYFDVDVTIIRLIFVIFTFITHGLGILIYIIMMFVIPWADTPEEKAAAYGEKFTADQFFEKASKKYEKFREKGFVPSSISQEQFVENWRILHRFGNRIGALAIGFVAGIVGWVWIASLWSIATRGTIFGYTLGVNVSPWITVLFSTSLFFALFWPLKQWIHSTLIQAGVHRKEKTDRWIIADTLGWAVWVTAVAAVIGLCVLYAPGLSHAIMHFRDVLTHGQKPDEWQPYHIHINTRVR